MRGISCDVLPIRDHAFSALRAKRLDLVGRRLARGVAGEALLAGLEELFGPSVIEVLAMASLRHSSAMQSSPRGPSSTMRIFSSAEKCRRVARGISRTVTSALCGACLSRCLIVSLLGITMSRKHSYTMSSICPAGPDGDGIMDCRRPWPSDPAAMHPVGETKLRGRTLASRPASQLLSQRTLGSAFACQVRATRSRQECDAIQSRWQRFSSCQRRVRFWLRHRRPPLS